MYRNGRANSPAFRSQLAGCVGQFVLAVSVQFRTGDVKQLGEYRYCCTVASCCDQITD